MKIILIIPSLKRGGAERVASILTQEWSKENDVTLCVFDAHSPAYSHGGNLIDLSVPVRFGAIGKVANFLIRVSRLFNLIRKKRPDVIISFMESANFPAILACLMSFSLKKLTVSVRNDPARFPFIYRILIPALYRLPRRVVAVSQGVASALVNLGVPKKQLDSIPNPAIPFEGTGHLARPIGAPPRYVLAVGRLHFQKGFDMLLRAFSLISDKKINLVIVGEGGERNHLENLAKSLNVSDRVDFPGAISDLSSWYQHAECFVLSSRYEGWPNVLIEALCNRCPVISFDCKYGPSEIVENGVSGVLVPDGNVEFLSKSIGEIVFDRRKRSKLVDQGFFRVGEFNAKKIACRWLEK